MPLRETAFQGYTLLALIYAGLAAAALYDLLSPLLNSRRWYVRLPGDLALSAAIALLALTALALTGCDSLRLYMPLAMAFGAAIYRLGVRRLLAALINLFRKNRSCGKEGE